MELRWLEDFRALARTRHFSRAAEEQNVTQPTFSRRIKLLEEEMGTTLINRQTLPLSLTPAGEEFLALCHDVTQRIAESRRRLDQLTEQQAGRIRLAAPQSLLVHFVPEWLNQWSAPPPVTPYLRATGWLIDDYFKGLAREECDLVLCYWPPMTCGMESVTEETVYRQVGEERLVPVSLAESDGRPRYDLDRMAKLPLIAYHPRGLFAAAIGSHLARLGDAPEFSVLNESIQSGNIRELVTLGYGVGWLPERTAHGALRAGTLVVAGSSRWRVPMEIRLYRRVNLADGAPRRFWFAAPVHSVT
ncbi:LysR family transcriptional regulator [Halomonas sp. TRM85114]|uniref:LysR family transcriptional regulator n=1 Tax=Halomonas jincaotanensis TaxID=2810616 RepID=UPI001BD1E842|nr:LysR family transcriptional regulator [Halomonas jincaotanensis]MBS9402583.1 LysR family transcriptional regulator [Halomonas jincaotanensis]